MNAAEMGARIKQCRKVQNLTQEKLAEKVDVSPHYIYEIERGTKSVSLPVLIDISKTLKTSLDYLVFGVRPQVGEYYCTDELQELLITLDFNQRKNLFAILKALAPHLKL